jgi:FKBP-type peptidyl-prolyl cis-trans isomerase
MFKHKVFFILLFSVIVASCSKVELVESEEEQISNYISKKNLSVTETTVSGLRFIRTSPNPDGGVVRKGQVVNIKYTGKLLTDKGFSNGFLSFVLDGGKTIKGFDEGIAKMKIGEKATIIFPSTLGYGTYGAVDIPANVPLLFNIEVFSIGTEIQQIGTYILDNKLNVKDSTASGLRYIQTKENPTGAKITLGQTVTVKYIGKLLTGKQFDGGDFSFVVGEGKTTKGFDEGILKMKVGEMAIFIIPSSIGYGTEGRGDVIPWNSPLLYDVQVISTK